VTGAVVCISAQRLVTSIPLWSATSCEVACLSTVVLLVIESFVCFGCRRWRTRTTRAHRAEVREDAAVLEVGQGRAAAAICITTPVASRCSPVA
jgi:hypothetical protein